MADPIDFHAPFGRDAEGKALAPYGLKRDGTPAKPKGFQKGGAMYKGPSRGGPAEGHLWGAGKGQSTQELMPPNPNMAEIGRMSDVEKKARANANELDRKRAAEEAMQVVYEKLHGAEHEQTQLAAAKIILDRVEGLPTQKVVTEDITPKDVPFNLVAVYPNAPD